MLLFLVDNKKGRSEALCLRISGDRAVIAKGLYNPQSGFFEPDNPETLNSNRICTSGEEKVELGNKLFEILNCLDNEDQMTLEEYAMDQAEEEKNQQSQNEIQEDIKQDETGEVIVMEIMDDSNTYKKFYIPKNHNVRKDTEVGEVCRECNLSSLSHPMIKVSDNTYEKYCLLDLAMAENLCTITTGDNFSTVMISDPKYGWAIEELSQDEIIAPDGESGVMFPDETIEKKIQYIELLNSMDVSGPFTDSPGDIIKKLNDLYGDMWPDSLQTCDDIIRYYTVNLFYDHHFELVTHFLQNHKFSIDAERKAEDASVLVSQANYLKQTLTKKEA